MKKLLPCPFCGREPKADTYLNMTGSTGRIRCDHCGLIMEEYDDHNGILALERMAKRWNKRVPIESKSKPIKKARNWWLRGNDKAV